jgi:hypothetical protein
MVDDDLRKRFREWLQKADEAGLEYEEKHSDAGDAYVHCVIEDKPHYVAKIKAYIKDELGIQDEAFIAHAVKEFDQWSFDMQSGHRFTTIDPAEGCYIWAAAIEEVELQYETKVIAEDLDCEVEDVVECVKAESALREFCIHYYDNTDTFYTYQATDACWFAVIPRCWFTDLLEEFSGD